MSKIFYVTFFLTISAHTYSQNSDLINKVDSLFFNQQSEKAVILLMEAVDDGSKSPYVYHRIGILKLDSYTPNNALDFLLKSRELSLDDSLNTALFLDIAQAKYAILDYKGALNELENIYDIEEYRIPSLTIAMNVYSDSGKIEKAIQISKEIIASEPQSLPIIANIGYLYLDSNKPDSAIYYFEKANGLQPDHPILLNNLGNSYYLKGKLSKALNLIERSISILDTNPYAFRNRALVLIALNRTKEACEDIDKAIELGYLEMYGDDVRELKDINCN